MDKKQKILLVLALFFTSVSFCQNIETKLSTLQKVFEDLVYAYGNTRGAPSLQLVAKKNSENFPASYSTTDGPIIKVEEQVFDLCMQMGADSLDALSIIVSHELAHYYSDHTWCTDYSYFIRHTPLGKRIMQQSKGDQLTYETQADNYGLFYCRIAGYSPFGIYDRLIDRIYSIYKLPSAAKGYPSKEERKMIARQAQERMRGLYPVYDAGLLLLYLNELRAAESCFDYLVKYFPSREMYNNLGIAKFLYALSLKPHDPVNFIYPVDIDPVSRLYQNGTRGIGPDQYIAILRDAERQFEKAKSLDRSYIKSYINLACVNDALKNYAMALGYVNEAEMLAPGLVRTAHLKAIIQYHDHHPDAETLLKFAAERDSVAAFNYRLLVLAKATKNSPQALEKFKDDFTTALNNDASIPKNCSQDAPILFKGRKSEIKITNRLTIVSEIIDTCSKISVKLGSKEIRAFVTIDRKTANEADQSHFRSVNSSDGCLTFGGVCTKKIYFKIN
jgi:hypothetical protein